MYYNKYFYYDAISFFSMLFSIIFYTEDGMRKYIGIFVFLKAITFLRMVQQKEEVLNFNGSMVKYNILEIL